MTGDHRRIPTPMFFGCVPGRGLFTQNGRGEAKLFQIWPDGPLAREESMNASPSSVRTWYSTGPQNFPFVERANRPGQDMFEPGDADTNHHDTGKFPPSID